MGIISWILLGLIAGAIAKAIMPGRARGGFIVTMLLGIVGGIVGGFIGNAIFGEGLSGFFSIRTWLLSIGGAIIVLAIYGAITGKKSRT